MNRSLVSGFLCLVAACAQEPAEEIDEDVAAGRTVPAWSPAILRAPNLRFSAWTFFDANGQPILSGCLGRSVKVTVMNAGNLGAPSAEIGTYAANGSFGTWLPPLLPGASTTLTLPYQHSGGQTLAFIDRQNLIGEFNENDNVLSICQ